MRAKETLKRVVEPETRVAGFRSLSNSLVVKAQYNFSNPETRDAAHQLLDHAFDILTTYIPDGHTDKPSMLGDLSVAFASIGEAARARATAELILDTGKKALALCNLGEELYSEGNSAEAKSLLIRAIEVAGAIGDRGEKAIRLSEIANTLSEHGEVSEASRATRLIK